VNRLAPALHGLSGASVTLRWRRATVVSVQTGSFTVVFAGGTPEVAGVLAPKGYSPAVGDPVLVERSSVATYGMGALNLP
jgi:hypothetical protein